MRTDDGGETWFALQSGTTYSLNAVTFFDADRGITSGGLFVPPFHYLGITLLTADGGATWAEVPTAWFWGLSFANPEKGVGVGNTGGEELRSIIQRTTDGGRSWRELSGLRFAALYAVSLVDTDTGTAVGRNGTIVRTTDGGRHVDSSSQWDVQRARGRVLSGQG